ncbi:MAG: hypothetical protein ACOC8E_06915 [Planctomycetota bacterium]
MPALSFSIPRLVPAILDGAKVNTFRVVRTGKPCRFDVGQPLYLYWKQRTRDCTKLAEARCVDLVPFLPKRPSQCAKGDFLLAPPRFLDLDALARADGFACWPELRGELWRMYEKLFLTGGIAAIVSLRWAGLQEDLFARTRLGRLGVPTALATGKDPT